MGAKSHDEKGQTVLKLLKQDKMEEYNDVLQAAPDRPTLSKPVSDKY